MNFYVYLKKNSFNLSIFLYQIDLICYKLSTIYIQLDKLSLNFLNVQHLSIVHIFMHDQTLNDIVDNQHCYVMFTILLYLIKSYFFLPTKLGSKKLNMLIVI